jgi:hypothetical protein
VRGLGVGCGRDGGSLDPLERPFALCWMCEAGECALLVCGAVSPVIEAAVVLVGLGGTWAGSGHMTGLPDGMGVRLGLAADDGGSLELCEHPLALGLAGDVGERITFARGMVSLVIEVGTGLAGVGMPLGGVGAEAVGMRSLGVPVAGVRAWGVTGAGIVGLGPRNATSLFDGLGQCANGLRGCSGAEVARTGDRTD